MSFEGFEEPEERNQRYIASNYNQEAPPTALEKTYELAWRALAKEHGIKAFQEKIAKARTFYSALELYKELAWLDRISSEIANEAEAEESTEEKLTAQLGTPKFGALPVDRPHQAYVPPYRNMPDAELAKQKPGHPISHPPHYTSHPSGLECIEVTRHMSFNCGNAVKYIWRHQDKGKPIQDLQKAIWYLQDEIKRITDAEIKRAEERGETHV